MLSASGDHLKDSRDLRKGIVHVVDSMSLREVLWIVVRDMYSVVFPDGHFLWQVDPDRSLVLQ